MRREAQGSVTALCLVGWLCTASKEFGSTTSSPAAEIAMGTSFGGPADSWFHMGNDRALWT